MYRYVIVSTTSTYFSGTLEGKDFVQAIDLAMDKYTINGEDWKDLLPDQNKVELKIFNPPDEGRED